MLPCFVHVLFEPDCLILQSKNDGNEKNDYTVCGNGPASLRGMLEMCGQVSETGNRQDRLLPLAQACDIEGCRCLRRLWQVRKGLSEWCVLQTGQGCPCPQAGHGLSIPHGATVARRFLGIGLHIAGHGLSHETWHYWGAAHIVSSVLWLLSVTAHAVRHRYWYQALIPERFTNRWRITFALSMLFMVVVVAGIGLLACVEGPNSSTGLWHYKLGLLLSALSLIHVFYRK